MLDLKESALEPLNEDPKSLGDLPTTPVFAEAMAGKAIRNTYFVILFFALSIIIGPGYNMYLHYDFSHTVDTKTYLAVAKGHFKDQSLTRRYRVIVPFAAAVVAYPVSIIYTKLWPQRGDDDWPLRLGFFIVNSLITALAGLIIFLTCLAYGASPVSSFMGMMAILAGRWANYTVGLPMTDSLYLLVIALTIYGIKTKKTAALLFVIFIGPFAKESFIFIAPIIFFWGHIKKWQQIIYFGIAGVMVWTVRYLIDQSAGTGGAAGISNAFEHVDNITEAIKRIFAIRGLGELFTVMGTFTFMILAGFTGGKNEIKKWTIALDWPCFALIFALIIHAALSGEVARMLFFGSPVWALMLALVLDRHRWFEGYRRMFGVGD